MRDLARRSLRPLSVAAVLACGTFLVGLHFDSMALRLPAKRWIHAALVAWILDVEGAGGGTVDPSRTDRSAKLAAAGTLVFGLSDTMIALDRFHAPFAGARYAIILTCWAALVLLAASAVTAPRPKAGA